ncbi:hypothetical protein LINPERHAP1_LOCUS19102 [Linum perenne]
MATGLTLSDVGELLINQKVSQPRQFRKAYFLPFEAYYYLSFSPFTPEDGPKRQASRRSQSSGRRLKEIRGWGRIVYVMKKLRAYILCDYTAMSCIFGSRFFSRKFSCTVGGSWLAISSRLDGNSHSFSPKEIQGFVRWEGNLFARPIVPEHEAQKGGRPILRKLDRALVNAEWRADSQGLKQFFCQLEYLTIPYDKKIV